MELHAGWGRSGRRERNPLRAGGGEEPGAIGGGGDLQDPRGDRAISIAARILREGGPRGGESADDREPDSRGGDGFDGGDPQPEVRGGGRGDGRRAAGAARSGERASGAV